MELHTTRRDREWLRLVAQSCGRQALELLSPTRCGGCDRYGDLLCGECAQQMWGYDPATACPRCGAPYGELVCTVCASSEFPWVIVYALGPLEGPLARSVILHKDRNERRLGRALGYALGAGFASAHSDWAGGGCTVTWVPPTPRALARRGFDHGFSLASGVARAMGCPCVPTLTRGQAVDSRMLGRAGRARSAEQAFSALGAVSGRILLVDDVLTTGATAAACSESILRAGAEAVGLGVIARTW